MIAAIGGRSWQTGDAVRVLAVWRMRALRASLAHYATSQAFLRSDTFLTFANVASSIMVMVIGVVLQLMPASASSGDNIALAHGLLALFSMAVVITAIFQYILNYGTRAAKHADAGAKYAALIRKIEETLVEKKACEELEGIRTTLDELGRWCPLISKTHWRRHLMHDEITMMEKEFLTNVSADP